MAAERSGPQPDTRLVRLRDLKDFQVAEGDPDIRGWNVRASDGRSVGKVKELVVDREERRVRYIEVEADRQALGSEKDQRVLIPIGTAQLNGKERDVLIDRLPPPGFAGAPVVITREYEDEIRGYYARRNASEGERADADSQFYSDAIYDDRRFWSGRERHPVEEPVEMRPVADNTARAASRDGEIVVPLASDEEVVVERRGDNDQVVIRKQQGKAETRPAEEAESRRIIRPDEIRE